MTDQKTHRQQIDVGAGICERAAGSNVIETDKDGLIRQYAAGDITWSLLRERGFDNYVDVLAALGRLGLRPPIAPMDGPNREARERGRAFIRVALKAVR